MPKSSLPTKKVMIFFVLAIIGIVVDQLTQLWATAALNNSVITVIPNFLEWRLAYNYGAAFSFLSDHSGWQRWFFIAIAIIAAIVLSVLIIRRKAHERILPYGFALIMAGAIGNVIDRIWHGFVIDFISVQFGSYYFPIFNVADICVSVGAGLVILSSFIERDDSRNE